MNRDRMLCLMGVVVGAAVGFCPAAFADDLLYPPGTIGPIGEPTDVQTFDASPFFYYHQEADLYHVLDGENLLGQFTDTRTFFESPYQPFGVWFTDLKDVISDSTYPDLVDGATHDNAFLGTQTLTGFLTLMGNEYLDSPGVASYDYVALLGFRFPLWDIAFDTASGAAIDPSGLADLASIDPSGLADLAALF